MPPPRKVDLLPEAVRDQLDARLIANGFAGYHLLSGWLAEEGFEISHSALGQHGLALKRKLAAIRASTEAAKLITDAARDDEDRRSEAVMSLVQTELFDVLVNLQEAADADEAGDSAERMGLLTKAAKAISELSRASVNQKKWAQDVRNRAEAAAAAVDTIARKGGLSADTAAAIRREILGIAA